MKRFRTAACLSGAVVVLSAAVASAQPLPYNQPRYGVGYQTPLSPYLNLLRGGNPAANYYLCTIPEFERRQKTQIFQNALLELDQRVSRETVELGLAEPIGTTGHITAFGNTGNYFGHTVVRPPPSRVLSPPTKPKQ